MAGLSVCPGSGPILSSHHFPSRLEGNAEIKLPAVNIWHTSLTQSDHCATTHGKALQPKRLVQCSEFDVRTTFWSVWTRTWHFNHWFGRTVFGFEAVWTDRLTKLGKVSFATWLTDRLDADVAFWKRFGPDKRMVQSGLSLMSVRTWSAIRNTGEPQTSAHHQRVQHGLHRHQHCFCQR